MFYKCSRFCAYLIECRDDVMLICEDCDLNININVLELQLTDYMVKCAILNYSSNFKFFKI